MNKKQKEAIRSKIVERMAQGAVNPTQLAGAFKSDLLEYRVPEKDHMSVIRKIINVRKGKGMR